MEKKNFWWLIDDATTAGAVEDEIRLNASTKGEAVREAARLWDYLTGREKAQRDAFYIGYAPENEDEDIGGPDMDAMTETVDFKAAWDESPANFDAACEVIMNGTFEGAVEIMDDEIREELHRELYPCDELVFLVEYIKRHEAKYGEDFPPIAW